jgi:AP-3 complex subunit delta-1
MALQKVKGNLERMFDKNLTDLVRGIRNNKEGESKYITQCLEEIKQELRQYNLSVKANAVAKLNYLQMLGYDISWAGFNVIEVMSSTKFTEKRIGYLAASQSFHQDTEVLMLATNMIRKDLSSTSMYEAGLTLSSLSCFLSPDLARDLANDVMSLLTSTKPYLRKKGVLLLYKVFLRYPEALRPAFPRLKEKLEDPDPGVQSAAVNVICELARKNPKNYLSLAPTFFKLMTSSTNNWMLIKIIKLFGALTPLEPRLGKKLIEPLTNLIHSTSAMSLLYECINTVIAVLISISTGMPNHAASIQLCVQKLRILIEDSDQNLKYLGLLAMSKILKTNPKSVSGHKDLIMGCLDDADDSIRLRALDLLSGMVSKKNLMEIVKKLMTHMAKAEGTTYRDELLGKIIQICSQNDYQYISNFEWYVSVLVELSQMEGGGGGHGKILAEQMMDVAIRVQAIRPFATQQMALLIDNSAVILSRGRRNSSAEVLYAAGWVVGEFCSHLINPGDTLQALVRGLTATLPPHIQAVYIQNMLKLYTQCEISEEVEEMMLSKLEQLVGSSDLEVQERASATLHLLKYVHRQKEKGEVVSEELKQYFSGELNPVAPKAQKKVPVPEGLDLDAWINQPEEEDSSDDEPDSLGGQVFVRDDPADTYKKKNIPEPTEEELAAVRVARLQTQTANPHYLRDTPKASPVRSRESVGEIPVQAIDLDIPLHIPGLANTDSYFNLSENYGQEKKKSKKKKKKSKKNPEPSSEEEEESGPNVFVSQNIDMPEGASLSDNGSDGGDDDDPHRALGNIVLDDILDTPAPAPASKKSKKKKKSENTDLIGAEFGGETKSPELSVEHKVHKKKKKSKKDSKKASNEEADLLGLTTTEVTNGVSEEAFKVIGQSDDIKIELEGNSCKISNGNLSCTLNITNIGSQKISNIKFNPVNSAVQVVLAKSLKAGVSKSKSINVALESGERSVSLSACISCEGLPDLNCQLQVPASAWLVPCTMDSESFAELLLGGQLAFMLSRQLSGVSDTLTSVIRKLVHCLGLVEVESQNNTASLYGQASDGSRLAFLVKDLGSGGVNLEGRGEDKILLAEILDQAEQVLSAA